MTFLVFEQFVDDNGLQALRPTGDKFRLAGNNLLKKAWRLRGSPLNKGWHVNRADLLDLYFDGRVRPEGARLAFDFHPAAKGRIGIVEPMDIYAYSFADGDEVRWTPLMLRLIDLFYEEYDVELTDTVRKEIVGRIPLEPTSNESVEFLYLQGEEGGWNWGRTGGVNAAFIQGRARNYFRQFF